MTRKLWYTPLRVAGSLFAIALVAAAQQGNVGRPGMINYTEGEVTLDGSSLGNQSIGRAEVEPGQVLETRNGRAEMLLTPGVFLRLDNQTAVKMLNPSITDTQVELQQGTAMVEVDQIARENDLGILTNGVETKLQDKGLYEFHANPGSVAVYDGKARVFEDDHSVEIKKGHELPLEAGLASAKPRKFDRDQTDQLYDWSKLRSGYVAEANAAMARNIIVQDPGWYAGTGWYWDPWYSSWAFVPGAGFIDSPFGFGFYSPAYWYYNVAPMYSYYGGYGYGGIYGGRRPANRGALPPGPRGAVHGAGVRPAAGPRFGGATRGGGFGGGRISGGGLGGGHMGGGRR